MSVRLGTKETGVSHVLSTRDVHMERARNPGNVHVMRSVESYLIGLQYQMFPHFFQLQRYS